MELSKLQKLAKIKLIIILIFYVIVIIYSVFNIIYGFLIGHDWGSSMMAILSIGAIPCAIGFCYINSIVSLVILEKSKLKQQDLIVGIILDILIFCILAPIPILLIIYALLTLSDILLARKYRQLKK